MKRYTLIALALIVTSCEHFPNYSYIINNSATSAIRVIVTNTFSNRTDTIIIDPQNQSLIAKNGHGIGTAKSKQEKGENLMDFTKMDIYKSDTIKSNTDFLKTSRWIYKETDKYSADYILTVNDSNF